MNDYTTNEQLIADGWTINNGACPWDKLAMVEVVYIDGKESIVTALTDDSDKFHKQITGTRWASKFGFIGRDDDIKASRLITNDRYIDGKRIELQEGDYIGETLTARDSKKAAYVFRLLFNSYYYESNENMEVTKCGISKDSSLRKLTLAQVLNAENAAPSVTVAPKELSDVMMQFPGGVAIEDHELDAPNDVAAHYDNSINVKVSEADAKRGHITIKIDPYLVSKACNVGGGPIEHILKKAMRATAKGHSMAQVYAEVIKCAQRGIEIEEELL